MLCTPLLPAVTCSFHCTAQHAADGTALLGTQAAHGFFPSDAVTDTVHVQLRKKDLVSVCLQLSIATRRAPEWDAKPLPIPSAQPWLCLPGRLSQQISHEGMRLGHLQHGSKAAHVPENLCYFLKHSLQHPWVFPVSFPKIYATTLTASKKSGKADWATVSPSFSLDSVPVHKVPASPSLSPPSPFYFPSAPIFPNAPSTQVLHWCHIPCTDCSDNPPTMLLLHSREGARAAELPDSPSKHPASSWILWTCREMKCTLQIGQVSSQETTLSELLAEKKSQV